MAIKNGFIKIYRSLVDWEWYGDANTTRLFIHLLMTVNYEDVKWQGIEIKRGQRVTSIAKLSQETGLSHRTIRTLLSYSHEDEEVVEKIASSLVAANVHIWIDKWQLNFGDSLLQKIEEAISDCSALLIMLSESSVKSEWCKKEITAGLVRELEERQVLAIPILLDGCAIPLFLKDKYYADFRGDFNTAISRLQENLLKVTDLSMRRVKTDDYLTDWAIDDGIDNKSNQYVLHLDSISFSTKLDYSIYCSFSVLANKKISGLYNADMQGAKIQLIEKLLELEKENLRILLPDSKPQNIRLVTSNKDIINVYIRRMGNNSPFDILYDFGSVLHSILLINKKK